MPSANRSFKHTTFRRLRKLPSKLQLRGKVFTKKQLQLIREIAGRFSKEGRTSISVRICRRMRWYQPNGWLKDRACRDVLRKLEALDLIRLPAPKSKRKKQLPQQHLPIPTRRRKLAPDLVTRLDSPLSLHLAKGNSDEKRWNIIVQEHHYLGHKITVGKCLKFLVRSGDLEIGAVALSEPAWAVAARDTAIRKLGIHMRSIANNSRFLLLPNIRIKNLASQVLSLLARDGVNEWERYYSLALECLETFVDSTRFQGTSYKAANWICVGETKGYRKSGAQHFNSQTRKHVFLYPIHSKARALLRNEIFQNSDNSLSHHK